MIGGSSPLAAVLTVVSVMCLSLLAVLCLRCKKKSKIIHEEHQIYNPQMFETQEEFEDFSTATAALDEQPNYQNISNAETGSVEHTYVAPLAISVYENEQCTIITDADQIPGVYANTHTSSSKEDEDDYENAEYLHQVVQEENDDEPEYVNEIC
ncbi:LAT2 domain-containing protein isoform X2 [Pseudoliparis swirei]|uniref:LAT2 domain-containing protein isoform X2 n=1 Tax=Pseudoliparis swirei TaxID=2059687 RepID=UPI0024BDA646|nr:LAT2 domain-containing protein isoform X2 [Pseudoliparis swirei]